jgi:hypothetical protein
MRIILLVAFLMGLSGSASAGEMMRAGPGFWTGNELFAKCEAGGGGNTVSWGLCYGYIIGAFDRIMAFRDPGLLPPCPPKGGTAPQVKDVVIMWLKQNPQARASRADSLIHIALYTAWPCPK